MSVTAHHAMRQGAFMKLIVAKSVLIGITASALSSCGGGAALSENERRYANTCTATLATMGQRGKESLCECTARIVVPKLTEGEINSFANMGPELLGKALTDELTRPHGFTVADNSSYFTKFAAAKPEIDRTCGT